MRLQLQEVDYADGAELAVIQATNSSGDELMKAMHPGLSFDAAVAASKERWLSTYGFGQWHHKKVVDADTGKIVALSRWTIPDKWNAFLHPRTGIPEGAEVPPRKKPATLDMEFAGRYGDKAYEICDRILQDRPNMMIDQFSILPEYSQSPAATLMLEWATKFADEHGLLCYCESSPESTPLYLEHGFEQVESFTVSTKDGKDITLNVLTKQPAAKQ